MGTRPPFSSAVCGLPNAADGPLHRIYQSLRLVSARVHKFGGRIRYCRRDEGHGFWLSNNVGGPRDTHVLEPER